eukprot:Protomagalhaensia_sp_Gyna_25__3200@NODE_2917_length_820_cov_79_836108_g2436_i0_p1_GENE_NODE_2917_length_820_cov_79_836108_g2436_i0NODE_2917_length_820_cov_79_836108_g2436_i0_p1_ORF_typecomplete_len227_score25_30Flavodoxin_2/PF02525_17/5_9e27FMN_red/PF03358_15/9_3e09Flavodoxin_5/PF12724_7/0_0052Flavodoxin_5/PF12724_7/3e03Lipase_GDSL_2/PF13472_6/0_052_NODE_2917_length_820_cov_79_836108_g2436_i098778
MSLLVINSSPRSGAVSFSKQLTDRLVRQLAEQGQFQDIKSIDLAADIPPNVNDDWIVSTLGVNDVTENQAVPVLQYSDSALEDWARARVVVIGAPMYNFGPTTYLKGYIDQLIRYNKSFTTPDDLGDTYAVDKIPYKGLMDPNKVVILVVCSSWTFSAGAALEKQDYLTPWLESILRLMGLVSIYTIRVDGLDRVELEMVTREDLLKTVDDKFSQTLKQLRSSGLM